MAKLYVNLDMSDVTSFLENIAKTIDGWPEDRKEALARDLAPMIDDGSCVDMDVSGDSCAAIISPAMHDVLRRHGALA
jgi:hypothetical protein